MTIYAGHQVSLSIAEVTVSPSFALLKGVRECRWQLEQVTENETPVDAGNWQQRSDVIVRSVRIQCTVFGASHTAQSYVRAAVLGASHVHARLSLADGTLLEGEMLVESYAEEAREDSMLEAEIVLISAGDVTVTAP